MAKKAKKVKKNIKKDINVVKEIKKRKVPIFITIIFFLIVIVVLLFLGIKINFAIKDELQITLEPQDIYIDNSHKTPFDLNFTIENGNFFFCEKRCSHVLKDVSAGEILDEDVVELQANQRVKIDYELEIENIGRGQKTYVFEIECKNIKSAVCTTGEGRRLKSSIVTVDFGLNRTERTLKEHLNGTMTEYLKSIKVLESVYLSDKDYISRLGSPIELIKANDDVLFEIKSAKSRMDDLLDVWRGQDYLDLSKRDFQIKQSDVRSGILTYVERFNRAHSLLNRMVTDKSLLEMHEFYARNNDNQIGSIISSLNAIRLVPFSEKFISDLELLNATIAKTKTIYVQDIDGFYIRTNLPIIRKKLVLEAVNNITLRDIDTRVVDCDLAQEINTFIDNGSNASDAEFVKMADNMLLDDPRFAKLVNASPFNITTYNVTITPLDIGYCAPYDKAFLDNSTAAIIDQDFSDIPSNFSTEIYEGEPQCCFNGVCSDCITGLTPVIFIHGHLVNNDNSPELSLAAFAKMQQRMEEYINGGQLVVKSDTKWRAIRPISVRASYYYITYYDVGAYTLSTQVTTGIENYAIRLKEIIENVKSRTGSDEVDIVAHSMGGLVAREYMALFGEASVNKLIMIATPNHGVKGSVKDFCGILGSDKECQDLAWGSIFLKRLNSRDPPAADIYTVRATGCDMSGEDGDGIALSTSVPLDFATNYEIKGKCTNLLGNDLHSNILDPDIYPQTVDLIIDLL